VGFPSRGNAGIRCRRPGSRSPRARHPPQECKRPLLALAHRLRAFGAHDVV
jgi:hypothetical protein